MLELLQRAAQGDTGMQTALLDEVEPLVFGYTRSLGEPFDRAVRLTHAAVLGFLLDLRAGRVRLADANALRRACHRLASEKMADRAPWFVDHEGDPESGALTPVAVELAARIDALVDEPDRSVVARRLRGASDEDGARILPVVRPLIVPE
ncbi:MAG: hypothetical protein AAGD14_06715 [Planctomycetota bacterium]